MSDSELTIRGGQYAGQPLHTPDNAEVRPMRSRIREAIFDRVSDHIDGRVFLDCFAGTGAMGLEALSRGAEKAVFIDQSPASLSCIRRNVNVIRPTEDVHILRRNLLEAPPSFEHDESFHMISITPPYRFFHQPDPRRKMINLIETISQQEYVSRNARLIVECEQGTRLGQAPGNLNQIDKKTFGNTDIHWFRPPS